MRTTVQAKARKVLVSSVAAAAVSLPLALASASSADAATTREDCTVTPLAPQRVGSSSFIRFSARVTCDQDRIVQIRQQRWESDPPLGLAGDDFFGTATNLRTFAVAGTTIVSSYRLLPNTEPGAEEIYQRVSFRVATIDGVTGWTPYEESVIRVFAN
jgi:hypothetical protein